MKKLIILAIFTVFCFSLMGQEWVPVGNPGSIGNANSLSFAIDNNNIPYVACKTNGGFSIKKYNESIIAWVNVGTLSTDTSWGTPFISIDNYNIPYIAYNSTNGGVVVRKYTGSSWMFIGGSEFCNGHIGSFAIDNNNTPYIVVLPESGDSPTIVMKYTDLGIWELVGTILTDLNISNTSIVFDNNNTPYISYLDYVNSTNTITVKKYSETMGTWINVGAAGFSGDYSGSPSLAIDNNNLLYVSYKDGSNNYKITVKKYSETMGAWINVGAAGFSTGAGCYTSIAINDDNTPYVAYLVGGYSNLTVMKYDNATWKMVGDIIFSNGYTYTPPSLIISNNKPYIAYSYNNLYSTVMKFENLFDANPKTGYQSLTVNFSGHAILPNPITSWQWTFGGGQTSTEQNPIHIYAQPGQYTVKLKIVDSQGIVDSLTKVNYITVLEVPPTPPQNMTVSIAGRNAVLNWSPVNTDIFNNPINVTGYIVYFSEVADTNFWYHGFTTNTSYTHYRVTQFAHGMFYRVTAFTGDLDRVRRLTIKNPHLELGKLNAMLKEEEK